MELLVPAILCTYLAYRVADLSKRLSTQDPDLSMFQTALYPIATLTENETSNEEVWNSNFLFKARQGDDMTPFMNYVNKNNSLRVNGTPYFSPGVDIYGPNFWSPRHCMGNIGWADINKQPLVAYIDRQNQLQEDLKEQISQLWQEQRLMEGFLDDFWKSEIPADNGLERSRDANSMGGLDSEFALGLNVDTMERKWQILAGEFSFKPFASQEQFDNYIKADNYGEEGHEAICWGFEIYEDEDTNTIQFNMMYSDRNPSWHKAFKEFWWAQFSPTIFWPVADWYMAYIYAGFSYLQNIMANTILKRKTGVNDASINLYMAAMQSNPFWWDSPAPFVRTQIHFMMMIFFMPMFFRTIYLILNEKTSRIKEVMRMMGMNDGAYWLSWFFYLTVINTMITAILSFIFTQWIFVYSDPRLITLFLWTFGECLFGWILFLQSFFDSPTTGSVICAVIYFCSGGVNYMLEYDFLTFKTKAIMTGILPPLAMAQGAVCATHIEWALQGNSFENWNVRYQAYSMRDSIIIMACNFCAYTLLGLWADRVVPSQYGERLNPLFFLTCLCDPCFKKKPQVSQSERRGKTEDDVAAFETKYLNKENYEPMPPEVSAPMEREQKVLTIADLMKVYPNGFKAVNGFNLKMYQDQIFVLLGHNGAGKSSTIGLLSGLYEPTKGSASVFGVDLFNDRFEARRLIGICPQYDVLFDLLTPEEHLHFFYTIKGGLPADSPITRQQQIDSLLKDTGVDDKRNAMSYQLSGGNKRKLSAAIALCGNSKLVIFDEPTAGLDLTARRQLWNLLRKYRKDRIIMMSTHYMDEADILGDRIAIMAAGKISCIGTSAFLKQKFGVGYNFIAVKTSSEENTLLLPFIKQHLGRKCELEIEIQYQISFKIPGQYQTKFTKFFDALDKKMDWLGISSYGMQQTTLEEVFIKVGHLTQPEKGKEEGTGKNPEENLDQESSSESENEGGKTAINQAGQSMISNDSEFQQADFFSQRDSIHEEKSQRPKHNRKDKNNSAAKHNKSDAGRDLSKLILQDENLEDSESTTKKDKYKRLKKNQNVKNKDQLEEDEDSDDFEGGSKEKSGRQNKKHNSSDDDSSSGSDSDSQSNESNDSSNSASQNSRNSSSSSYHSAKQSEKKAPKKPVPNSSTTQKTRIDDVVTQSTPQQLQIPPEATKVEKVSQFEADKNTQDAMEFNMREHKDQLDTSICRNVSAQIIRRVSVYYNAPQTFIMEFIFPCLFSIFALSFILAEHGSKRSDPLTFNGELVPNGSPLLFNPEPINAQASDIAPSVFVDNWLDKDKYQFNYVQNWNESSIMSFEDYSYQSYVYGESTHPLPPYFFSGYGIYRANKQEQKYDVINWLNLTQMGATGNFPNLMYNSILRVATDEPDLRYNVSLLPMPLLAGEGQTYTVKEAEVANKAISVSYSLVFLNLVGNLIVERQSGLVHLQIISGLQLKAYWFVQFLFDYFKMGCLFATIYTTMMWMPGFTSFTQWWPLGITFPFSALPFCYVLSLVIKSQNNGQVIILGLSFFSMVVMVGMVYVNQLIPEYQLTGDMQLEIFRFTPFFPMAWACFTEGSIFEKKRIRDDKGGPGYEITTDLWTRQNFIGDLYGVLGNFLFWTFILIIVEARLCVKTKPNKHDPSQVDEQKEQETQDDDVYNEIYRVDQQTQQNMDAVHIQNFTKEYFIMQGACPKRFRAVNNLSFGVGIGESFALLGVNGAGKSTSFKSMTNDVIPTSGKIHIGGYDLHANFEEARKLIGYCPQHNLIYQQMTVEQHVWYFARIKGIPGKYLDILCEATIDQLGLQPHRKKQAGSLSGGNMRKVNVAIATIGNPPVILLDEPSSGMDPGARRFMWQVVSEITKQKRSAVVLTTHSMEEAEALCTKMAIMVKGGRFRCFGPGQHLKAIYGTGYLIEIKIRKLDHWEVQKRSDCQAMQMYNAFHLAQGQLEKYSNIAQSKDKIQKLGPSLIEQIKEVERNTLNQFDDKVRYVHAQINLYAIIHSLCKVFGQVELIEQFSNSVRVRVERQDKKIGNIFALLDELQSKYDVASRAVSETTLEQIFQSFVDEKFEDNVRLFGIDEGDQTLIEQTKFDVD